MKKPVCEICEGQKFIKKDGVFECSDCGTQYSIEEIKKLIIEIADDKSTTVKKNITEKDDKKEILCALNNWYDFVKIFNSFDFFKDVDASKFETYAMDSTDNIIDNFISLKTICSSSKPIHKFLKKAVEESFLPLYVEKIKQEREDYYENLKILCDFWNYYNKISNINDKSKKKYYFEWCSRNANGLYVSNSNFNRDFALDQALDLYAFNNDNNYKNYLKKQMLRDFSPVLDGAGGIKFLCIVEVEEGSFFMPYKKTHIKRLNIESFDIFFKYLKRHINKTFKKYSEKEIIPLVSDIIGQFNKVVSYIPQLEENLYLPLEYRTEESIVALMKLFQDGKVSTMKEALNLLDTQTYREAVIEKLGNIENHIKQIKQIVLGSYIKLIEISDNIKMVNNTLTELYEQNQKILNRVKSIELMTFLE